jgi:hypothetical protein
MLRSSQIAFQKAISVEEKKVSVTDSLHLETMEVEEKYDGPRLTDDNKVSFILISISGKKFSDKFLSRLDLRTKLNTSSYLATVANGLMAT